MSPGNPGPEATSNPGKFQLLETPTIFPALGNAFIQGGTFIHASGSKVQFENHSHTTRTGFEILHQNIASGAFHDSRERFEPAKCHPNTRVAVLAEIMAWIEATEESEDVLWLYGSAGAGKTAIAQTIAEKCAKLKLLIASFFFSRASQSRNNEKHLIATIAYQLAISVPATRSYIESAVQIDPAVFHRSLDTQIETLIIRPLEEVYAVINPADTKQWPRVIIIDGLDECHDPSIQCSIISVLSAALRRITVPILLFIASRPEAHIRHTFNVLNKSHASHHIVLDDSYKPDADIKTFLLSRFHQIKENHQFSINIPKCWPPAEVIDRLVRKSSGQFIYASTVMKYLESPKRLPMKQLDVILGLRSVDSDMPYKELDALYSYIFSCVEDLAITRKILGFLFFGRRSGYLKFTPHILALLVGLDDEDVYLHLSGLHSILHIPPLSNRDRSEIRPTHASLQDFLVDGVRSQKYYFDEEVFHTDVAQQCVRQINMLVMNPGLEDFSDERQHYLVWGFAHHCTRASTDSTDLKNELMQVSGLWPFFRLHIIYRIIDLFTWLYKVCHLMDVLPKIIHESQADGGAKELSGHIQSLWDRYLTSTLNRYTFDRRNVDIAGLLFLPEIWNSRWFSLISGVSEVPDIFLDCDPGKCQDFLSEFFEDENRSGKYHVNGTIYAHAALECFRNMINPNSE